MLPGHRYWRFHLRLVAVLLALAVMVSVVIPLFGRQLAHVTVAGWPLPFYMGGQGALLVYLVLLLAYGVGMRYAERRLGNDEIDGDIDGQIDSQIDGGGADRVDGDRRERSANGMANEAGPSIPPRQALGGAASEHPPRGRP